MGVPFPLFDKLQKKLSALLKEEDTELKNEINSLFDNTKKEAKIDNEIAASKRNFFFSSDSIDSLDKSKEAIKRILIEGLIKKKTSDNEGVLDKKREKEIKDKATAQIVSNLDSILDGKIKVIEPKKGDSKGGDKKDEKKKPTLYKVSFTKFSLTISDDDKTEIVKTWAPDLLLTGVQTYNKGKKSSFVNITREIPYCARNHVKKLNEIAYKIRQKSDEEIKIKTKTVIDFKKKRFELKYKKVGDGQEGKWVELESFDADVLAELNPLIKAAKECIYKPFVFKQKS